MEREKATSSQRFRFAGNDSAEKFSFYLPGPFSGKIAVSAMVAVVLLVAIGFGVTREAATTGDVAKVAIAHGPATPPRPAYTRDEELYIQALWPIHGDVERATLRLSLGKILYKTQDLSKADLKYRTDTAMAIYQSAEERLRSLQPPPSLVRARDDYLAAVQLFKQATFESLKMFEDGDDEHLLVAYPLNHEGSTKIRAVGARFWQDEFPPN